MNRQQAGSNTIQNALARFGTQVAPDFNQKGNDMNIQGKSALVTGGGSGLGEATARELARLGAKVAVLDVNLDNAQRVAADIGAQ